MGSHDRNEVRSLHPAHLYGSVPSVSHYHEQDRNYDPHLPFNHGYKTIPNEHYIPSMKENTNQLYYRDLETSQSTDDENAAYTYYSISAEEDSFAESLGSSYSDMLHSYHRGRLSPRIPIPYYQDPLTPRR